MSRELSVSHILTLSVIYHWTGAQQHAIYFFLMYERLRIMYRKLGWKIAIKGSETSFASEKNNASRVP